MKNKILVEFDIEELRNKCKAMQHYPHNCCLPDCKKFVHSDCVKQYEEKLLKKASELGLELEVIHDDN